MPRESPHLQPWEYFSRTQPVYAPLPPPLREPRSYCGGGRETEESRPSGPPPSFSFPGKGQRSLRHPSPTPALEAGERELELPSLQSLLTPSLQTPLTWEMSQSSATLPFPPHSTPHRHFPHCLDLNRDRSGITRRHEALWEL